MCELKKNYSLFCVQGSALLFLWCGGGVETSPEHKFEWNTVLTFSHKGVLLPYLKNIFRSIFSVQIAYQITDMQSKVMFMTLFFLCINYRNKLQNFSFIFLSVLLGMWDSRGGGGEAEWQTTTSIFFSAYSHRLIRSCGGYILI